MTRHSSAPVATRLRRELLLGVAGRGIRATQRNGYPRKKVVGRQPWSEPPYSSTWPSTSRRRARRHRDPAPRVADGLGDPLRGSDVADGPIAALARGARQMTRRKARVLLAGVAVMVISATAIVIAGSLSLLPLIAAEALLFADRRRGAPLRGHDAARPVGRASRAVGSGGGRRGTCRPIAQGPGSSRVADAPRRGYRCEHMGNAPFGYYRRRNGRLALDAGTGPIVTELFRRRAQGATIGELPRVPAPGGPLPLERHTHPADYASIVSVRPWMGRPTSMRRCASWTTKPRRRRAAALRRLPR